MDPSSKGDQPFVISQGEGKSLYVVCNGEIYNYKDIIKKYDLHPSS
ncbi:TPA: hypothetical protein DEP21_04445 [Patescibacteria group bacterium]|nr:hypothetical protein [Candidatus Gracilibacteria bacterium]